MNQLQLTLWNYQGSKKHSAALLFSLLLNIQLFDLQIAIIILFNLQNAIIFFSQIRDKNLYYVMSVLIISYSKRKKKGKRSGNQSSSLSNKGQSHAQAYKNEQGIYTLYPGYIINLVGKRAL